MAIFRAEDYLTHPPNHAIHPSTEATAELPHATGKTQHSSRPTHHSKHSNTYPTRVLIKDTIIWLPLSVILLLALLAQYMWVHFSSLALQPNWQPAYQVMCYFFDCQLPEKTNTASFYITNLLVSSPSANNNTEMKTLEATLTNKSHVTRPLPRLFISFRDINHKILASGYYDAQQYLPYQQTTLEPGKSITVYLAFLDPGTAAINYDLRLMQ